MIQQSNNIIAEAAAGRFRAAWGGRALPEMSNVETVSAGGQTVEHFAGYKAVKRSLLEKKR